MILHNMEIFADTSDIEEIKKLKVLNLVDGIMTSPILLPRDKMNEVDTIKEMLKIIDGSIHIEVFGKKVEEIVTNAVDIAKISDRIIVKLPITEECIKACAKLSATGIAINMTPCFSPMQALIAAKAGAAYVSIFVGYLDDVCIDGVGVLSECCMIWQNYPEIITKLIATSMHDQMHVLAAAKLGIDAVSISPKIIHSMFHYELADKKYEYNLI